VIDAPVLPAGPVTVVITADNAYSFGYGDAASITNFTQGTRALSAGQIFNCGEGPETYVIPEADAPPTAYLYMVTWDDLSVTQGVLAQFTREASQLLTGDAGFEVCATGIDFSSGPNALTGPDLTMINTEIATCNAGTGNPTTTSRGWVTTAGPIDSTPSAVGLLAVGQANDGVGSTFPSTCPAPANPMGIASAAKWMWYDPVDGQGGDAFHSTGVNRFKAFLIFRLGVASILL
jgi:hypothetical protein